MSNILKKKTIFPLQIGIWYIPLSIVPNTFIPAEKANAEKFSSLI